MKIALTGIKPSGRPHLGNYLGMIRPALELARDWQCLFFIADYHALTTLHDGPALRGYSHDVAATWLALGLDPERALLYRQSDVPEIPELAWILSCVTAKGLLDRAHAFKDATADGREVNAGVYTYPVLMAADILAFGAHAVPVGKDQKQHLEICRDIALRFNHTFGDLLVVPDALIQEAVETIPGLDGRKMSKSYGNTVELFQESAALRKQIMRIATDSTPVEAPKQPESAAVFQLYRLLAPAAESDAMAQRLRAGGTGWAVVKQALFDRLEALLAAPRKRYDEWMAQPERLEATLLAGAARARAVAQPRLAAIRHAVGAGQ